MRKVAGLDARSTYVVVTIVSNDPRRVAGRTPEAWPVLGQLSCLTESRVPDILGVHNGSSG